MAMSVPELERPLSQRLKRHAEKHGIDNAIRSIALAVAKYRSQRDLADALEHSGPAPRHGGGSDEGVRHSGPGEAGGTGESVGVLDTTGGEPEARDDARSDAEELV